jgi:hypothetical protein
VPGAEAFRGLSAILTALPAQGFGSMPIRSLTADRIRCLHPKIALRRLNRNVPQGELDAPTRYPRHGRVKHRSVAERAATTSLRRCAWRIPSQCPKPPSPSCHFPCPSSFVDPAEQFSSVHCGCGEPIIQFGSYPIRNWNQPRLYHLHRQHEEARP